VCFRSFVAAWTDRSLDPQGDIAVREVRRFGPPLQNSAVEMSVQTAAAEYRAVIAGARGSHVLLAYQEGTSPATTRLRASSIDPATLASVQGELVYTREKDLSVARASQGVWLV
jgi:hypothetical protein